MYHDKLFNSLYTGRPFHRYMLDESISHFRVVGSILSRWKILLANTADPDHTPQYVAYDLGLHCLPFILLCKDGLM